MLAENFATVWEAIADSMGSHEAILQGSRRVAWSQFEERSARVAGALADRGVRPGDKVALIAFNCPEFLEILFAAFKLRAVPVAFNYRFRGSEFAEVLEGSDSVVAFFHASLAPELEGVRSQLHRVREWVVLPDGAACPGWATPFERVLEAKPTSRIARSGDDQFIQYTGGTTGRPKGVVWRHSDIAATVAFLAYMPLGLATPDTLDGVVEIAAARRETKDRVTYLPTTPLMHAAALYTVFAFLQIAGRVVLLEGRAFDAEEFCETAERERVTNVLIVGDTLGRPILDALDAAAAAGRARDLSSLARLNSAGLTFSAESKQRFQRHAPNLTIFDFVGGTEGGPYGTCITPPGADPGETAVFTATPGTILVDEETGEVIPQGSDRIGLIGYTGALPFGYYNDEEKTAATFREIDGTRYAVTGDCARIDADGRLHLLGRGNTCINTGGEKVFPEEVEEVLKLHPTLTDCIVVAVPDPSYGSAIAAVVARAPGAEPELAALAAHVKEHLAGYKQPRHLVVVDEVRRTAAGKQDYRWAREIAEHAVRQG